MSRQETDANKTCVVSSNYHSEGLAGSIHIIPLNGLLIRVLSLIYAYRNLAGTWKKVKKGNWCRDSAQPTVSVCHPMAEPVRGCQPEVSSFPAVSSTARLVIPLIMLSADRFVTPETMTPCDRGNTVAVALTSPRLFAARPPRMCVKRPLKASLVGQSSLKGCVSSTDCKLSALCRSSWKAVTFTLGTALRRDYRRNAEPLHKPLLVSTTLFCSLPGRRLAGTLLSVGPASVMTTSVWLSASGWVP